MLAIFFLIVFVYRVVIYWHIPK